MKSPCLPVLRLRTLLLALILAALARSASGQLASGYECTVISGGSATVDDSDFSMAGQSGSALIVNSTGPYPAVVDARVDITGIKFQANPVGDPQKKLFLALQFRDNGTGARVRAFLTEVSLSAGAYREILAFDSDAFPASTSYQTQQVGSPLCRWDNVLYLSTSLNFVRLELTKSNADGYPAARIIRVCQGYECSAPTF